ncbi:MAG: 5-(carboxyamino)imidazole ribonucleotide synthase [Pseudomonadota bacterium]
MSDSPLAPGATVGILGGGQLGRMLAIACARLGLHAHIYEPGGERPPPAAEVARHWTDAAYGDDAALDAFAAACDVVTLEFENIPVATVERLARRVPVRPGARALAVAQDRAAEKTFIAETGLSPAPWAAVDGPGDIAAALAATGTPAILKTRRLGYDGKGQARIADAAGAEAAWAAIGAEPAVLEATIPFTAELSVIVARGADGTVAAFDPGRNEHEHGILRRTTVPAGLTARVLQDAVLAAGRLATALDYVGVMGVELFVAPGGRLIVNEIAPRVHNTGHWTIEACATDQFAQHIRAVAGWPLADARRHADAVMTNLLGDEIDALAAHAAEPGVAIHHYGKGAARPGRKMGHITRLAPLSG